MGTITARVNAAGEDVDNSGGGLTRAFLRKRLGPFSLAPVFHSCLFVYCTRSVQLRSRVEPHAQSKPKSLFPQPFTEDYIQNHL